MQQYLAGLKHILDNGVMRTDRTGKGRLGVFCPPQERYDLRLGFPLVTTRQINPIGMIDELLWFILGDTSIKTLKASYFWDRWALTEEQARDFMTRKNIDPTSERGADVLQRVGTIGNLYGVSWRHAPAPEGSFKPFRRPDQLPSDFIAQHIPVFGSDPAFHSGPDFRRWLETETDSGATNNLRSSVLNHLNELYWKQTDQLNELIVNIKERPYSSRLRVTAMLPQYMAFEDFSIADNIADGRAALTPCHAMFQFYVNPNGQRGRQELSMSLTMTSNDYPVGRVYNIAQYALLLSMVAQVTDMVPAELIVNTNDGHIYADQIPYVREQIERDPMPLPTLRLNPDIKDLFAFTRNDILIDGYTSHGKIPYPVAV